MLSAESSIYGVEEPIGSEAVIMKMTWPSRQCLPAFLKTMRI